MPWGFQCWFMLVPAFAAATALVGWSRDESAESKRDEFVWGYTKLSSKFLYISYIYIYTVFVSIVSIFYIYIYSHAVQRGRWTSLHRWSEAWGCCKICENFEHARRHGAGNATQRQVPPENRSANMVTLIATNVDTVMCKCNYWIFLSRCQPFHTWSHPWATQKKHVKIPGKCEFFQIVVPDMSGDRWVIHSVVAVQSWTNSGPKVTLHGLGVC